MIQDVSFIAKHSERDLDIIEKLQYKILMSTIIKLADPGITDTDKKAVLDVLDSGHLANGPMGKKFEEALLALTGRKYAVVVSSGTMALFAAMKAMGIQSGSKVIVPAFTFPAPASAAAYLGAAIDVCDVDPETFCMTAKTLEPKLDKSVSLVIAVDQFGVPANIPEIEKLTAAFDIPILVDAACSIGSAFNGRPCGSFGAASTFSFHPRKIVTTQEGGAVLTDDDSIAERVRRIINHGMGQEGFVSIGLNMRMAEAAAALGISQLSRLDSIITGRLTLSQHYSRLPIRFQEATKGSTVNYQTMAAVLPGKFQAVSRNHLLKYLKEHGIEANIAGYCLGAVPVLARRFGVDTEKTPVALMLHERGIALPLHTKMSEDDVKYVATIVFDWLRLNGIE